MRPTTEPIPLARDADGVVRVGAGRVALDTVLAAFREGMTPEEMVEQCPSPRLAEVGSAIGDVLRHPEQVEMYLHKRRRHAKAVRRENEARFDPLGVRDRLLARRRRG